MNYGFHCSDSHETGHHSTTLLHCISFNSVEKYGECGVVTTHYDIRANTQPVSWAGDANRSVHRLCELTAAAVVKIQTRMWTLMSAGRLIQRVWSRPSCLAGRSDGLHLAVPNLSFADTEGRQPATGFQVHVSGIYKYLSRTASISDSGDVTYRSSVCHTSLRHHTLRHVIWQLLVVTSSRTFVAPVCGRLSALIGQTSRQKAATSICRIK
jgi:hypothetical protein